MKHVLKALLLIILFSWIKASFGENSNNFKPGDWFEAEMEFENGLPVFHNHWANNDSSYSNQEYLSIRFTFKNEIGNVVKWSYEILRYRQIIPSMTTIEIKDGYISERLNEHNLHCFDTWYPNYFQENFDSIRSSLIGELWLKNGQIVKHKYAYNDKKLNSIFRATTIFPTKNDASYGSSSIIGNNDGLNKSVERMVAFLFATKQFQSNEREISNYYVVEELYNANTDSIAFSISADKFPNVKNKFTPYFLANGLAYAYTDVCQQKVMAITNASFALPNKAYLTIIDKRNKKEEDKKYFNNITLRLGNDAHVIFQKVKTENNVSKYSFELKCGVEITFGSSGSIHSIFIVPRDSIQITIQDEKNNPIVVKGIDYYNEYKKLIKGGTKEQILVSSLSPECKAYLILKNKIASFNDKLLHDTLAMKDYQKEIVDVYYLKSCHYRDLYDLNNELTLVGMGNNFQQNQIYASGAPFLTNFRYKYYNALSNFSHFSLYAELYRILKYSIKLDKEAFYNEFLMNCGDTLMTKQLRKRLDRVKSVQSGKILPLTTFVSEDNTKINILPEKGTFGLLFLYVLPYHWKKLEPLFEKELPKGVQYISCQVSRNPSIKSNNQSMESVLNKADFIDRYGNNRLTGTFENYLYGSLGSIMILYDENGKIWYNSEYSPVNEKGDEYYINEIKEAIEKAKAKPINKSKNIFLIFLSSVIGSITLTFLFYRIRIAQLKKKNARNQLIQELKLKSVQSQLNPHFLFNALNSIQVLVKSGDTKRADNYLVGFSELLRNVLQNAEKRLVPLSDELAMISRYCELEKLRMDFDCDLEVNTTTSTDLLEVPYMLLQPLIENAIKHGVAKANEKGLLRINIEESGSELHLEVTDNGPGFGNLSLEVLKEKGRGLKLSNEKLQSIYGNDAEFVLLNANPGTTVSLKLKIG